MQYIKANFKYAAPVAGNDDIMLLKNLGLSVMARLANSGDKGMQATIQRLVNSGIVAEGSY